MVDVPALPGSIVSDKPLVETVEISEGEALEIGSRLSPMNRVLSYLDSFSDEQLAEVYIWLAEHPMNGVDPVRLAIASFEALKEDELPAFFSKLKDHLDPELWEILTTD